LTGELRYVAHPDRRLAETARFGLERVVVPAACLEGEFAAGAFGASTLTEALALALEPARTTRARAA
jgi:predicted ATP-dependent serine protease